MRVLEFTSVLWQGHRMNDHSTYVTWPLVAGSCESTDFFGHLEMLLVEQAQFVRQAPEIICLWGFRCPSAVKSCVDQLQPKLVYCVDSVRVENLGVKVIHSHILPQVSLDCCLVTQAQMVQLKNPKWLEELNLRLNVGGLLLFHALAKGSFSSCVLDGSVPLWDVTVWAEHLVGLGWGDPCLSSHDVAWEIGSAQSAVDELDHAGCCLSAHVSNRDKCGQVPWPTTWTMRVILGHAQRRHPAGVTAVPLHSIRHRLRHIKEGVGD